jgi:pyridoxine 5-phosphate synthase
MKRLSLLLDDVAHIRTTLNNPAFDPVQLGILGETAGANGLVCTWSGSDKGISERDLRILKEVRKSFVNFRIPVQEEAVHLALSITPDMVTFVDVKATDPRIVLPVEPALHLESIEPMLSDLQANNISVSALIPPEIGVLKSVSKLSIDYVEIDASDFTGAQDINLELVSLDKIKSAAVAAAKLGLGVNCSGGIGYNHIPAIARIPNLEDITIGGQLIQRALWVGVERAVLEALQLIRHREID